MKKPAVRKLKSCMWCEHHKIKPETHCELGLQIENISSRSRIRWIPADAEACRLKRKEMQG